MDTMTKRAIIAILALTLGGGMPKAQEASVLADGDWWRLMVRETGMYAVTTAEVPALQGASISAIGVYGAAGTQLPLSNAAVPTDGLQPVASTVIDKNGNGLFDATDKVVFFGEGCDAWRYNNDDLRWEMQRHAYASVNHYYISASAPEARRVATAGNMATTDTTITTYTAVAVHNNDLVNIYSSGQLWMGEKFTSAIGQRTVTLTLPSSATDLRLRYALACKSTATGTFSMATTGLNRTHPIAPNTVYTTVLEAVGGSASSLTFTLGFTPGEASAEGYLDYIELSGHTGMGYNGGQLLARNDQHLGGGSATFSAGGSAAMRVWDVTHSGAEREMTLSGRTWTDSTTEARCYALWSEASLMAPAGVSAVEPQNLLGASAAEYIVVSHPTLLAQAERIAGLHAVVDGMTTLVVSDREVYNEFSSGKQDPIAIRTFMRSMRRRHPDAPPRYLLLMGKGTYDNRDLLGLGLPTVATYETVHSFDDEGLSYCSDDMLAYLDDHESGAPAQTTDIGVGRLPARSLAEATHMVDKIEGYMMRSDLTDSTERGDWRNYVALLADDADPSRTGDTLFAHSSEVVAERIKAACPELNIERLYADAYRQQSGAIGSYYPDLNNALRQRMNYGCLLLNYIGHGSIKYIGTERYIEPTDVEAYTNIGRLPLFVTSTCSYGYHDMPDGQCGAETFLTAAGGAVSVISASRPISHNERFNSDLIMFALDKDNTIGDALRMAKNRTMVSLSIGLLGDPGLRLCRPVNQVVVTHIGGRQVQAGVDDTATVLSEVTVRGEVRDAAGQLLPDFDGTVYPIVFDRESESHTLANDNPGTEVSFRQQKSILYKGAGKVSGGTFEYTFTVPRDVAYQYDYAKLSHYARSAGGEDATGSYGRLMLGGLNEEIAISEVRPEINLYLGDTAFRDGGICNTHPTLVAVLRDSVGINAFGSGLGHDITATIDGSAGSMLVLNDFYQADLVDPRGGTVRYTLDGIAPGRHTLTLKAWNIWGFSNTATVSFTVHSPDTAYFSELSVWPNPASDAATFHYETNNPASISNAELHIYSPQGALIQTIVPSIGSGSFVVGPARWDLSQTSPGIYMARILVTTTDGQVHQSATKIIVR